MNRYSVWIVPAVAVLAVFIAVIAMDRAPAAPAELRALDPDGGIDNPIPPGARAPEHRPIKCVALYYGETFIGVTDIFGGVPAAADAISRRGAIANAAYLMGSNARHVDGSPVFTQQQVIEAISNIEMLQSARMCKPESATGALSPECGGGGGSVCTMHCVCATTIRSKGQVTGCGPPCGDCQHCTVTCPG